MDMVFLFLARPTDKRIGAYYLSAIDKAKPGEKRRNMCPRITYPSSIPTERDQRS